MKKNTYNRASWKYKNLMKKRAIGRKQARTGPLNIRENLIKLGKLKE